MLPGAPRHSQGQFWVFRMKFDCLLLLEVSCHFAVVFGLQDCGDDGLRKIETALIVEYISGFHCQILGWFEIIVAILVSVTGTQT